MKIEPELLSRVREGDPLAVDAWFRAEHPLVWRVSYGVLGDRSRTDDLAQTAMLKLLDHLTQQDPADAPRSYPAWRNRVVLNLCRDDMRRLGARRRAEEGASERRTEAQTLEPSSSMDARETQALLEAALRALPDREREAFVLRELEDYSTDSVAESMAINAASVRSLLTLARRRLREYLSEVQPCD